MADLFQELRGNKAIMGAGAPAGQVVKDYYSNYVDSVRDVANDIIKDGLGLMKFTLSEVGLYKTAWRAQKINGGMLDTRSDAPESTQIFVCGDYFLPLNIRFSVNASKKVAESQLVDGIAIYECINRSAKTVTCTFDIERVENTDTSVQGRAMEAVTHIMKASREDAKTMRTEITRTAVKNLTKFLQDIYENEDVFEVVNPVLNNELGVSHAFLKSYSITPQIGSTFFQIAMTLQEVNVNDSIIWAGEKDSGEIPAQ